MAADIYLLGSGVLSFLDITLYTQRILKQCRRVMYLHDMPTLDEYLTEVAPQAQNLMPMYYLEGRERDDIYDDIVNHVLAAAEEDRPVGLLLHGHPLVYSNISTYLIQQARTRGYALEIVPALSSLDRMFVDLELDIGDRGVQILHTTTAVLNDTPINPKLDCFLLQIGMLLNPRASRGETATPEQVLRLKNYLLQYYPRLHPMTVVESAVELGFNSRLTGVVLDQLEQAAGAMNYTSTLFAPAVSLRHA